MTYPKKTNGKLRISLNPKDLNKSIIRENHKVDGNKAFFGMHLTRDASLLTTFNTHLGSYRFLQIPFGLKMSQDIS